MTTGTVLRLASGRSLILGKTLGAPGKEGVVYTVEGFDALAVKLYHPASLPARGKADWFVQHREQALAAQSDELGFMLAWPVELIFDPRGGPGSEPRFCGLLLARVPDAVDLFQVINPRSRRELAKSGWAVSWRDLHHVARRLALAVATAHDLGLVLADLSDKNALVVRGANEVALIDLDSAQVRLPPAAGGAVYRSRLWSDGFLAPEYMMSVNGRISSARVTAYDRSRESDAFALGILIFQLLCNGRHPYAHIDAHAARDAGHSDNDVVFKGAFPYQGAAATVRPPLGAQPFDALPPVLRQAFAACFVAGHGAPAARPTARQWADALGAAVEDLVVCPAGHWHTKNRYACHVCGRGPNGIVVRLPAHQPAGRADTPTPSPIQIDDLSPVAAIATAVSAPKPRRTWRMPWPQAILTTVLAGMLLSQFVTPLGGLLGNLRSDEQPTAVIPTSLIVGTSDSPNGGFSPAVADGDPGTTWSAERDDDGVATWVQVDIGASALVDSIEWFIPKEGAGARFQVQISTDRRRWIELGGVTVSPSRAGSWASTHLGRTARYIRLAFLDWPGNQTAGALSEIAVTLADVSAEPAEPADEIDAASETPTPRILLKPTPTSGPVI